MGTALAWINYEKLLEYIIKVTKVYNNHFIKETCIIITQKSSSALQCRVIYTRLIN